MENKQNDGYTGIWKNIGCLLSIIVGLVILGLIVILILRVFKINVL